MKMRMVWLSLLAFACIAGARQAEQWAGLGKSSDAAAIVDMKMHTVQAGHNQLYQGNLVLVDRQHPVREAGRMTDIVKLYAHPELKNGYGLMNATVSLSRRVAEKWQLLVNAASEDGIRHFVMNSGYRDEQAQEALYEEKGPDYALPPGYSEHNLGLSMDIGSTETEMSKAAEGKWLSKHAWKYGFILRYPRNKTEVTGIQFEPWHFRYVGLPHSELMHAHNWTLEEYLAALKERGSMTATYRGVAYVVTYYPASPSGRTSIRVPDQGAYAVSGDNSGGIIVTVQSGGRS